MSKLISIIVPVFNEQDNLGLFYDELQKVFASQLIAAKYSWEIIFVDDGSLDNSKTVLNDLAEKDAKIKLLEFSRNFGKEVAITAGLNNCSGAAAIIIDADLQHPLGLIPEFLQKWEQGIEVVIGVRQSNKGEKILKRLGSYFFYQIINSIGNTKIIPNATDYRLLDRMVIEEFNRFTERNRITRGLIDWLGFNRDFIYFQAQKRKNGKAGYTYLKLFKLAISGFISHSFLPLKLAGYLGLFITLISGSLGLFILVEKYILNDPWQMHISGSAILAVIILFLVGIILICLGLMALYIANIYAEVTNRPIYVIRQKKNLDK